MLSLGNISRLIFLARKQSDVRGGPRQKSDFQFQCNMDILNPINDNPVENETENLPSIWQNFQSFDNKFLYNSN